MCYCNRATTTHALPVASFASFTMSKDMKRASQKHAAAETVCSVFMPSSTLLGLSKTPNAASPWSSQRSAQACRFLFTSLDVAYLSVLYLIAGSVASIAISRVVPPLNPYKAVWKTAMEVVGEIILTGLGAWIISFVVSRFPTPVPSNLCGHKQVMPQEFFGGVILAFSMYFFQKPLGDKMKFLRDGIVPPRRKENTPHTQAYVKS